MCPLDFVLLNINSVGVRVPSHKDTGAQYRSTLCMQYFIPGVAYMQVMLL